MPAYVTKHLQGDFAAGQRKKLRGYIVGSFSS